MAPMEEQGTAAVAGPAEGMPGSSQDGHISNQYLYVRAKLWRGFVSAQPLNMALVPPAPAGDSRRPFSRSPTGQPRGSPGRGSSPIKSK